MRILIVGDSWGCGVWPSKKKHGLFPVIFKSSILRNPPVIHQGVEFFLSSRGYEVVNLSISGGSNHEIFNTLSQTPLDNFDYVFVFFTNPLRDLHHVNLNISKNFLDGALDSFINAESKSLTFNDFISISNILALDYKKKLENLSCKNDIYLIGGHSKIPNCFSDTTKSKILIPSLREYFYKEFKQSEFLYEEKMQDFLMKKFDLETLEMFQSYADEYRNLRNIQKEFFWPDGHHLNIAGHKVLADYIHDFIVANRNLDNKEI